MTNVLGYKQLVDLVYEFDFEKNDATELYNRVEKYFTENFNFKLRIEGLDGYNEVPSDIAMVLVKYQKCMHRLVRILFDKKKLSAIEKEQFKLVYKIQTGSSISENITDIAKHTITTIIASEVLNNMPQEYIITILLALIGGSVVCYLGKNYMNFIIQKEKQGYLHQEQLAKEKENAEIMKGVLNISKTQGEQNERTVMSILEAFKETNLSTLKYTSDYNVKNINNFEATELMKEYSRQKNIENEEDLVINKKGWFISTAVLTPDNALVQTVEFKGVAELKGISIKIPYNKIEPFMKSNSIDIFHIVGEHRYMFYIDINMINKSIDVINNFEFAKAPS